MSRTPWYKRYPTDFLAGTIGMTLEEKGAYSILLDLIYAHGGPVADDARYIAGVCGCSVRKWKAIRASLIERGKVVAQEGFLSNPRADEETMISRKLARKFVESGRKGGEKSAEMRGHRRKNNDLDQGTLKHARATDVEVEVYTSSDSLRESSSHRASLSLVRSDDPPTNAAGQEGDPPPATLPVEWARWAEVEGVAAPDEVFAKFLADRRTPGLREREGGWFAAWRCWVAGLRLFGPGLEWLARQTGKPDDKLRGLLGDWCRRYGELRVLEVMREAHEAAPNEPVSWIAAALSSGGVYLGIDTLPDEWAAWAVEHGLRGSPEAVFEAFRDYWAAQPGMRGKKRDWSAAWRTWVRREAAAGGRGERSAAELAGEMARAAAATLIDGGAM